MRDVRVQHDLVYTQEAGADLKMNVYAQLHVRRSGR